MHPEEYPQAAKVAKCNRIFLSVKSNNKESPANCAYWVIILWACGPLSFYEVCGSSRCLN